MKNNEPVAWMLVTGHGTKILEKKPYCEVDYWKPLYTHPVKELTISIVDIDNVIDQFWYSDDAGFHFHYYDFAEAILRKAQEK